MHVATPIPPDFMENPFSALLHLFFPERCIACGRSLPEGARTICPYCRWDMPLTGYARSHDNPVFQKFAGLVPVVEASSLFFFTRGSHYRDMIHSFKYRGQWRICLELGTLMGETLRESDLYQTIDCIVPIPLHFRRRLFRGYNQAEYLAEGISHSLHIPVEKHCLKRHIHNPSQASTRHRNDRWENVRGIFTLQRPDKLAHQHILLVDDVLTTGATLITAAETLLEKVPDCRISIMTLAVSAHDLFGRKNGGGL